MCSNLAPPEVRSGCAAGGNVLLRKGLVTGEIRLASRQRDGRTPATFVGAASFDVNRDGNRVLFVRTPEASGGQAELLVHDLDTSTTTFLGMTAGRYPQEMARPVRMIRDGLGAVYSVGALLGEALYLATGPGELVSLACPRSADYLFPCDRFDDLRALDVDHGEWYDVAAGLTPDGVELTEAEMADNGTLVVMPYDDEEGAVLAQRLR